MLRYKLAAGSAALLLTGQVFAQNWNPSNGWKDSYSVDGVCYCDSNGFDHGADQLTYDTPIGELSVVQICADITSVLGTGRSSGRALYNDLQCGNGPPNNAGDEDADACPGRVDMGPSGCQILGPKWDLEAVYGDNPQTPEGSKRATANRQSQNAGLAIDGNRSTRWTTREVQQPGQTFTLDLGESEEINQVILDSAGNPDDGPAGYRLALSDNGRNFSVVATGTNGGAVTTIGFPDQSAQYIQITQTGSKSNNWWSIHEINVSDDGDGIEPSGPSGDALDRSNWVMYASSAANEVSNAIDGNSGSRWSTRQTMRPNQYFEIDMQSAQSFSSITLDTSGSSNDFPSSYDVLVSNNGNNWSTVASGSGSTVTNISFSEQNARYIRIEQNGSSSRWWWSIHELNVYR